MSLLLPPLPPPPPPPPAPSNSYCTYGPRCKVLSPEEEVSTACARQWKFMTGNDNYLGLSVYYPVEPLLQYGPQCGLVALCAAGELLLGKERRLNVDFVYRYARDRNFTSQGEMFSVQNMACLAEELLCCRTIIGDSFISRALVVQHLALGWPLLIPYDSDANDEPCLKMGHSAHWAVITGFCLLVKDAYTTLPRNGSEETCNLYHVTNHGALVVKTLQDLCMRKDSRLFVYARQGKSRRLCIWCYKTLCDSNRNLQSINPKYAESEFVLPQGGILTGLQGQMILLFPGMQN